MYSFFPTWNQSVVPCPVLTVFSWPAYRFLRRQVRWSASRIIDMIRIDMEEEMIRVTRWRQVAFGPMGRVANPIITLGIMWHSPPPKSQVSHCGRIFTVNHSKWYDTVWLYYPVLIIHAERKLGIADKQSKDYSEYQASDVGRWHFILLVYQWAECVENPFWTK